MVSEKMQQLLSRSAKSAVVIASMTATCAFADGEVAAGIASIKTEVLTYIGLGIAAAFALMLASLAPDIGLALSKKWIKKGAK